MGVSVQGWSTGGLCWGFNHISVSPLVVCAGVSIMYWSIFCDPATIAVKKGDGCVYDMEV